MDKNIIIFGSLAYDYQLQTKQQLDVVCQNINASETTICPVHAGQRKFGGNGGNIAFYLAKLDCKPLLLSTLGHDANFYKERLQSLGLSTDFISIKNDIPSTTVWLISDQSSSIAFFDDRASQLRTFDLPNSQLKNSIVHIAPGKPHITLAALQKAAGIADILIWDPGQDTQYFSADDMRQCIEQSTILIVNQYELKMVIALSQMSMDDILQKVIVLETCGKNGVRLYEHNKSIIEVAAVESENFVSSWGAGDAFRSGFLYSLQKEFPLQKAAEIGCRIASVAVQSQDSQNEEIEKGDFSF